MKTKILSIVIIVATFMLSIIRITNGIDDIILHWDLLGNVTSYGSKYLILLLPIISCIIFFVLRRQEKYPFEINRLMKISNTENNRCLIVKYLRVITPVVLLILLYIAACSAQYLLLHSWIILVALVFIIGLYIHMNLKLDKGSINKT